MLNFKTSERNENKNKNKNKPQKALLLPLHWQDLKTGDFGKSTGNYALAHTAGESMIFTTFREVTGY